MELISAYEIFTRVQLNSELAVLREQLTEETQKTSELDGVLARRTQNLELTARLDTAEAILEASRDIRDFLRDTQLGNLVGFSDYFKDLSRASMEGLSINSFSFSDGGDVVSLQGQVRDSTLVPRYVDNIERGTSPLRAMHYNPRIFRGSVDEQYFSFVLSTSNE